MEYIWIGKLLGLFVAYAIVRYIVMPVGKAAWRWMEATCEGAGS